MMDNDDLISRAAAIEAAFKDADEWDGGFNPKHLRAVPAVDAAPVVHARLIKYEPDMHGTEPVECSACNYLFARLYPQNYCPNCGAKLDGERRDDNA